MEKISEGLWHQAAPQSFYGLQMGTRMTVVRLQGGGLLIHSPISLTPALKAEVDAIAPVRHIVAPSRFHHLYAGEWKSAYPQALLHAAVGVAKHRKDLAIDQELRGDPHPEWQQDLESTFLAGTMLNETVFLHRPSRSLIVADLLENFETSPHWPTRTYLKLAGVHGKAALSSPLRMAFRDKKRARRVIDEILGWDFDRIVLAHGKIIESGGNEALRDGYRWLRV
jgi:hypothetical protein